LAEHELIIDIGADVSDLEKGMDKGTQSINKLDDALDKAASGGSSKLKDVLGNASDGFGKLEGGAGKLGGAIGGLAGNFSAFAGPVGLAVGAGTAFVGFLGAAAKAAAEEQVGIERLNQTLKNSIPNWDGNTQAVDSYISKQEKLAFADDELRDSLNHLVAQTGDLTKAQELQATAMDLARAKGMSLEQASKLVGKVDLENIGILQRYGIAIDKNATSEEALAKIRSQTAGQAEKYASTTEGSLTRIQNSFGNIIEDIGGKVLGLIEGPLGGIADFLQGEEFQGVASFVTDVLGVAFEGLGMAFETVGTALGVLKTAWDKDWGGIRTVVETVGGVIMGIINGIRQGFEWIGKSIGGALEFLGLKSDEAEGETKEAADGIKSNLEGAAADGKAAADKAGRDIPAGFKTAADGSIEQARRMGIEVSSALTAIKPPEPITIETIFKTPIDTNALGQEIDNTIVPPLKVPVLPIYDPSKGTFGGKDISQQIEDEFMRSGTRPSVQIALEYKFAGDAQRSIEEHIKGQAISNVAKDVGIDIMPFLPPGVAERLGLFGQEAGASVTSGMTSGVVATAEAPAQAIAAMAEAMIAQAQGSLESRSPSQVFFRFGEGIPQGLGGGITAQQSAALLPLETLLGSVKTMAETALTVANYNPYGGNIALGIGGGVTAGTETTKGTVTSLVGGIKGIAEGALTVAGYNPYGSNVASGIGGGVTAGTEGAKGTVRSLVDGIKGVAEGALTAAAYTGYGRNVPGGVGSGISSNERAATGAAGTMATNVGKEAANASSGAYNAGAAVPAGMASGISANAWKAINAANKVANDVIGIINRALDIHSPSRVTYQTGDMIDIGLAHGITENQYKVNNAIIKMVDDGVIAKARERLKNLPEEEFAGYMESLGFAMSGGTVTGYLDGWGKGVNGGKPAKDVIAGAACDAAHEAVKMAEGCMTSAGGSLGDKMTKGLSDNQAAFNEAADAYANYFVGNFRAMEQAVADFNRRMAEGVVAVGNYVSGPGVESGYGPGAAAGGGGGGQGSRPRAMAEGGSGWVSKPTLFLAGEAGREHYSFVPERDMARSGSAYFGPVPNPSMTMVPAITVVVELDGEKLPTSASRIRKLWEQLGEHGRTVTIPSRV
jgi:hypothetical protein